MERGQGLPRAAGSRRRSGGVLLAELQTEVLAHAILAAILVSAGYKASRALRHTCRGGQNGRPHLQPAARRFWKAQLSSQPELPDPSLSSRSWACSVTLWTRLEKAAPPHPGAASMGPWGASRPEGCPAGATGLWGALAPQTPASRVRAWEQGSP